MFSRLLTSTLVVLGYVPIVGAQSQVLSPPLAERGAAVEPTHPAPAMSAGTGPETVGPFQIIAAPTSASLIAGGGSRFAWLNVDPVPLSVNEAYTGFSVIDRGYGNADEDTILEMTFAPGVAVNGMGDDLVLLTAFSFGSYAISTDHDGFATELVIPGGAFVNTGVIRDFYYDEIDNGPFPALVNGTGIELSDLGVPVGTAVEQVRIRTVDFELDPLGLGVLEEAPPAPTLPTWGLVLASGLLAATGILVLRRRRSMTA